MDRTLENRWPHRGAQKRFFTAPDTVAIAGLVKALPKRGHERQLLAVALLNHLADDLPLITALLRHIFPSDVAAATWLAADGGRSNRCRLVQLKSGSQEIVNEMFRLLK